MIEKLIEWSARNRFLVSVFTLMALAGGFIAMRTIPLDAIPDLSDTQVIIRTDWMGRDPGLVEDQVTYPIVSSMLSVPKVKTVRGYSMFGTSFVYVIFEDGTDPYWARSRILEYLQAIPGGLPQGVNPELGPDATGVGWVFEYALIDTSGKNDLSDLRTFNDFYLRYWLQTADGVSEVAPFGGFVREYQVELDPEAMAALGVTTAAVVRAVKDANGDAGGRVVEIAEHEHFVRALGYIKSTEDLEKAVVGIQNGTPVLLSQVAKITMGPGMRRGVAELDGQGEVVGGIVVMRYGENALKVIESVKEKLAETGGSFPEGVELVVTYDRSELIEHSIETLVGTLVEESIIVSLVIFIFLWSFRSSLAAVITLVVAVVLTFIPMRLLGLSSNIMSLGGIAVAIGAMVDAAVVIIENAHKHMEKGGKDRLLTVVMAAREIGRPVFFALLIIAVSFIPIFALTGQAGRLFSPLAWTKTLSMLMAALVSVTVTPFVLALLMAKKVRPEKKNPISRALIWLYNPAFRFIMKWRWATIGVAALVALVTPLGFLLPGSEFMPPLNEGTIMYMPTTVPGITVDGASKLLRTQDSILAAVPEVERVFGKAGRAETATDPAPLSMIETNIILKPKSEWRKGVTWDSLIAEMDSLVKLPGVANSWTMPIRGRIDMLTTGIRTPIGIKIYGPSLDTIEEVGKQIEMAVKGMDGVRSVYAERSTGGWFLDFEIDREMAARYGLNVLDVERVIESVVGGMPVTTAVQGRERYPVVVRYMEDYRSDPEALKGVYVTSSDGEPIPMSQLAHITTSTGPPLVKSENGMLTGWVYVDVVGRDVGGFVKEAKERIEKMVDMPGGYVLEWSGQFELMQEANERLLLIGPLALLLVFLLLFLNFRSVIRSLIVMASIPFALSGGLALMLLLNYQLSTAVAAGFIALAGVAAQTGVVMLVYLDEAYKTHNPSTKPELYRAVWDGAVSRVRPKVMTVATMTFGLIPILWSSGAGADVMKRIAAPMVGGLTTSLVLTLLVIPAVYYIWRGRKLPAGDVISIR